MVAHSNAILEGTQTKTWLVNNDAVQSDGADRGRASAGGYESLAALGDASLPLVYLDIAIKGRAAGQIVILLFPQISPNYAENFRWGWGEGGGVMEGCLLDWPGHEVRSQCNALCHPPPGGCAPATTGPGTPASR